MKQNFTARLIILSIFFIIVSVFLLTVYNIYFLNEYKNIRIQEESEVFISKQKKIIETKVRYVANTFKLKALEVEDVLKKRIKVKIDNAVILSNAMIKKYKNTLNKKELNHLIHSMLTNMRYENKNEYIFITDLETGRVLGHPDKNILGKHVTELFVMKGHSIFNRDGVYEKIYFTKLNAGKKKYEKLLYTREIKELNWIIGTGIYLDELKKEIQEQTIKSFEALKYDNNHYLFLFKLYAKNQGEYYGEVIINQGNASYNGKKLKLNTTSVSTNTYRKSYLKLLKENNEGFISYSFPKSNSKKENKKMSFLYLVKDWNWVIGSGFYFDDLQKEIDEIHDNVNTQIENYIYLGIYISIFLSLLTSFAFYLSSRKTKLTIDQYAKDIKMSNDKLKKQKNVFKTLYEKSSDGIALLDKEGTITDCNYAILKMMKYQNKKEFIGLSTYDISASPEVENDSPSINWNQIIAQCSIQKSSNFECIFVKKDGEKVWCDIAITEIELDDKTVFHSVIRNISRKKSLELETQKQQIVLAQQTKKSALGDMIGNIAHQWRQPLNNVSLTIQYLRDNCINLNEKEIRKDVDSCMIQLKYMSKTIDDFTNFINPRKQKEEFNLQDTFLKVFTIISAQFDDKNIKIKEEIDFIKLVSVENELMQVIINILNNAKDALKDSSLERFIFINVYKEGKFVVIKIKDNAGGIDNKIINRIFEPYFTTKKENEGVGIGLYMVEEIIEKELSGTIGVKNVEYEYENKIFRGALFTISFKI